MFYFMEDFEIANYADEPLPFSTKLSHKSIVEILEISSSFLFMWFWKNCMTANTHKSHLLLSVINKVTANIDGNLQKQKMIKFYLV